MPQALAILAIVQGIIAAAPVGIEIAKEIEAFLQLCFSAKLISKTEQDAIRAYAEGQYALMAAGLIEPCLVVEPDPV